MAAERRRVNARPILAGVVLAALVLPPASCDQSTGAAQPGGAPAQAAEVKKETVKVGGKPFKLELALDDKTRYKGLSDRTDIDADGGMLFVFPRPITVHFVMRDCPVPIDIIFLDASGRITAMHAMVPEPPRGPDERAQVPEEDQKYNDRLKKYPSKFASQFVIELKGGTLKEMNLKEGERVNIDTKKLAQMCQDAEKAARAPR